MSNEYGHITCPNCGFNATENYCARCGQETHLHNETFWGLIMHFIGHYFHYDSKFWQTIKALWTRPGKLTIAYWNKQRMRYIPPISLYIFISFVFFFVNTLLPDSNNIVTVNSKGTAGTTSNNTKQLGKITFHTLRNKIDRYDPDTSGRASITKMEANKEKVNEEVLHMIPKVFFFLIPVMGLILLLLFYKRKDLTYVNHIIFALHYHAFWFSVMLLAVLYQFKPGKEIVTIAVMLTSVIYFVAMLKRVYGISWLRSSLYSLIIALVYFICSIPAFMVIGMILESRYS